MMGRLQTWIDRLGRSRRRSRVSVSPARRRPLNFELCESRLALSAAALTAVADGDTIHYAELMAELWTSTPGSAEWAQVSFGIVHDPTSTQSSMPIDFTIDSAALPPLRERLSEGGLISVDAFVSGVLSQFVLNRQSNALVDAAFDRLNFGIQAEGTGATLVDSNFGLNLSGVPIQLGDADSAQSWEVDPPDVPDLLGDAEATNPTVEGGALTTTTPILRITAPLDPVRNEGGRIDLTAMAGPTSLERHASFATLAGPVASRVASRAADDLPAAANNDNLRARAVVYEVAYERDADRTPAPGEIGASLDAATEHVRDNGSASSARVAVPLARRDLEAPVAEPATANGLQAVQDGGEMPAPTTPDASDSARRDASSERDAAMAAWGDDREEAEPILPEDDDGGLALTDARQRNVGLAIALAVTAAPLARRYRRSKQAHTAERNAGLS